MWMNGTESKLMYLCLSCSALNKGYIYIVIYYYSSVFLTICIQSVYLISYIATFCLKLKCLYGCTGSYFHTSLLSRILFSWCYQTPCSYILSYLPLKQTLTVLVQLPSYQTLLFLARQCRYPSSKVLKWLNPNMQIYFTKGIDFSQLAP